MSSSGDTYENLVDFVGHLRQRGYDISTEQCVTAESLLVALAASGEELNDPRRLGELLAPIFSTSPEEQNSFRPLYEKWLDSRSSPPTDAGADNSPDDSAILPPRRRGLKDFGAGHRWMLLGVVLCLIIFIAYLFWQIGPDQDPNGGGGSGGANITKSSNLNSVWWLVGAVVFAAVVIVVTVRSPGASRRLQLKKGQARGEPRVETFKVETGTEDLGWALPLRMAARELRRHRQLESAELNVAASVDKTIRSRIPTPVFGARKLLPEYLILIGRKSFDDQLARLEDEIVRRLIRDDVYVERFYFQDDPRLCRRDGTRKRDKPDTQDDAQNDEDDARVRRQDGPTARYFTLTELAALYPEHNLIVFGDLTGFFNPRTGLAQRWLKQFSPWSNRILFTPEPLADDYQRRALSELGFLVFPTVKSGMIALGELLGAGDRIDSVSSGYLEPLPPILREGHGRWMENYPPPLEKVDELCAQLRGFLGDEDYFWLSSCAVYPRLHWELAYYLGGVLTAREGLSRRLWSLLRLPWFQHGSMPDWLRRRLISELPWEYELKVRETLNALLASAARGSNGTSLPFVRWMDGVKDGGEKEFVFLSFMSGFRHDRLSVLVPPEVRSLLLGDDEDVRQLYTLYILVGTLLLGFLAFTVTIGATAGFAGIPIIVLGVITTALLAVMCYALEIHVLRGEKALPPALQALASEWASGAEPEGNRFRDQPEGAPPDQPQTSWFKEFVRANPFSGASQKLLARLPASWLAPREGGGEAKVVGVGGEPVPKAAADKHPKGLYVLFAMEMWERFSFYSMLAMFTLYLRDGTEGFGWTAAEATSLYANYLMFVYLSPLVGGFIADRFTGYRRAVMIGGLFFIAGHLLLSFSSLAAVYAALTCLVIGNGFFKPNVSTMVGNLYPEGSHLKDRAYNIFYMGINVGAFLAPLVAGWVRAKFGFHPAFAVAAGGMVISVWIMFQFRKHVIEPNLSLTTAKSVAVAGVSATVSPEQVAGGGVTDAPQGVSHQDDDANRQGVMDAVPEWKRIVALIVIFAVVIVFWMVFHQSASTLTYFADANTDWTTILSAETAAASGGIISNAINPFWVITLTFPLVWFWGFLDKRGLEPSTPTKMAFGMTLTALSFFILYFAAKSGEASALGGDPYAFRVSPMWLVLSYFVVTTGELMLSPMGLSLVSKVAPIRLRGLMMGGWFVATAMGNKLTQVGIFWDRWLHSTFFLVLGGMALVMAVVLFLLLKPLKKAMPGV